MPARQRTNDSIGGTMTLPRDSSSSWKNRVMSPTSSSQQQQQKQQKEEDRTKPWALEYKVKSIERLSKYMFLVQAVHKRRSSNKNKSNDSNGRKTLKNMLVLLHKKMPHSGKRQLTLIHPIRLDPKGEEWLEQLGQIYNVIQLKHQQQSSSSVFFHQEEDNRDDDSDSHHDHSDHDDDGGAEYYRQTCGAKRWAPTPSLKEDHSESGPSPSSSSFGVVDYPIYPNSTSLRIPFCRQSSIQLFWFQHAQPLEMALLIPLHQHREQEQHQSILITSDVLQNQRDNPYYSMPRKAMMKWYGYILESSSLVISPFWLQNQVTQRRRHSSDDNSSLSLSSLSSSFRNMKKSQNKKKKLIHQGLRQDFEHLLRQFDFHQIVGSTGAMVTERAKEDLVLAIEHAFPPTW